jgi:TonB family protein
MRRATALSTVFHALAPVALIAFITLVLKIPFQDWFKPKAAQDLTFVLVSEAQTPSPKQAQFRGNANQHAGGKRDTHKPPKPAELNPSGGNGKSFSKTTAPPKLSKAPGAAPGKAAQPTETPTEAKTQTTPPTIATPDKQEPVATVAQPLDPDLASGGSLVGDLDGLASASGGAGQGSSAGTGSGTGSTGNAQGGEGAPGVDVAEDVDFGPFMAELERRIKKHWAPPRGSDSRKVMLLFYLARDGKLVKIETRKTSGDEETDRAAVNAVIASTPFIPFPPQVKEDILPVEFTFDYNVLNPKKTQRGLR